MTQVRSPNAQAAMIRFAAANQKSAAANDLAQDPAFRSSVSTTISRWTAYERNQPRRAVPQMPYRKCRTSPSCVDLEPETHQGRRNVRTKSNVGTTPAMPRRL